MYKNGGIKHFLVILFLFFAIGMFSMFLSENTFAGGAVGWGDEFNHSAASQVGCKIKSDGSWNGGSTNWHDDTCFGLSWQYYKWPTENGVPINSDIQFKCTGGTCNNSTSPRIVSKDCRLPENGGGFWYLGYEIYGNLSSYRNNSNITWWYAKKNSNGTLSYNKYSPTANKSLGIQLGKPQVGFLAQWVSADGVTKDTGVTTGLYPYTSQGTNLLNDSFYSHINDTYLSVTGQETTSKGYTPGRCSEYGYDLVSCVANTSNVAGLWPKIYSSSLGKYRAVEAEYYGSTLEVKRVWDSIPIEYLVTGSTDKNFSNVNYFCAGELGGLTGRSGVQLDSGTPVYNGGVSSSSTTASVDYSSSAIPVSGNVTVTFLHEVTGAGTTKVNFAINQSGLKSGSWADRSVNYSKSTSTTVSYTRARSVASSELSASGTKICDTMTFSAGMQSTACVTLKKQDDIPSANVNASSTVTVAGGIGSPQTSMGSNGGNGDVKTVRVNVPVMTGGSESVSIRFDHAISALSSSGASMNANNILYTISQAATGTAGGASATDGAQSQKSTNMTATSSSLAATFSAGSPNVTVSGITATTDYTVCQTLTVNYMSANRTSKVCARIVGHTVSSSSSVARTGATTATDDTDNNSPVNIAVADVVVVSGSKTVTLNFSHTISLSRHSGITDTVSGSVNYKITQSVSNSSATVSGFSNINNTSGTVSSSTALTKSSTVTVKDIKASTDITVCQKLEATRSGKTRTTEVCARVIGSSVSSWSSVLYGSGSAQSTSVNGATADWSPVINITVPAGETKSVDVYFNHGVKYTSNIGSGSLSSNTSVTISQWQVGGSETILSDFNNKTVTLSMSPANLSPTWSAWTGSGKKVTISGITSSTDVKVCQKMVATRDGNTNTTTACARVVGNPVTGVSTASPTDIYVTVLPGSSAGSTTIQFTHTVKITRTKNDSGTINTGDVPWTIKQTLSGLSSGNVTTIGTSNTDSGKVSLTLTAGTPMTTGSVKTYTINVSNISASTDGTVCQELTISGSKTTACARIRGRNFVVRGQSSVGNSSTDIKKTTGWKSDATSVTADLGSIYSPYNSTSTKNVYFVHELSAQLSGNTYANVSTGDISYSVSRGSASVISGQKKSFSVSDGNAATAPVRTDTVPVSVANGSNKVCQKISFTYGTTTGAPEACATITGVPPTFSGKSAVTANGMSVENTTNGGTTELPEIKLKVALTKTVTQRVYFGHNMTATSTMSDAKGKSTGTMAYTVSRDYGSNTTGNFTGTFPSNDTTYSSAVGASNDYVDVTVGPGETKTVCQTMTFTGWSSKVCAKVTGVLILPELKSQSSITYGARSATTDWADKDDFTKTATISSTIYVPVREVEEGNQGKEISLKFIHNIAAELVENMSWLNTGDVPYTIKTTHNDVVVDTISGSFNHTVTAANLSAIVPINTNNWTLKVKQGNNIDVCQAFEFDYRGRHYNTTACAKIVGIPADPQGRSAALVTGYEGQADTAWVNGRVSRHTVHVNDEVLSGNAIVFNHFIQLAGERTITIDHFTITNDYDSKLSSSGSVTYTGTNESSYSQYSFYTKGRPVNITSADALGMIQKGSACETLSFDYEGINYTSTACLDFEKDPPMYMEDDCPDLTTYHSATSGETLSYSYVRSNTKDAEGQVLIYAKPTDKITFTHCYYPGAQETRYTDADESPYRVSSNNGKTVIIPVRNAYIETVNDIEIKDKEDTDSFVYNNNNYDFSLYGQILRPSGRVYSGVVGNYKHTMFLSSETAITSNAVGGTLEQSLWTYTGSNLASGHDRANCGSNCLVYYKNGDDNNWYNPTKNTSASRAKSSAAQVIVPYNYITTARVDDPSDVVYPGDTMSGGNVKVDVLTRNNTLVGDNYATKTASSMVRLYTFYTENSSVGEGSDHTTDGSDVNACSYYSGLGFGSTCEKIGEVTDQVFNAASNIAGKVGEVVSGFDNVYNVPDLPAGSKVCMGVSVYPAASTNIEPSNGKTFVSKAYCRTVAKKPSFQIWGGSLYSAGNVKGTVATKYTIKGVNDDSYSPFKTPGADGVNFGSWVEHAILANGLIRNVSSAAGTAYGLANMEVNAANPGGAVVKGNLASTDFCNRSRLSFANTTCSSGYAGKFGISGGSYTKTTIQQEYATKAEDAEKAAGVSRNSGNTWTTIDLSSPSSYTQIGNVRYTFIENGNLAITASDTLDNGITHVIYAKKNSMDSTGGNIVIYGTGAPISYGDGNYQDLSDIPQYVIIADGNLYIDRLVTRIDAILIAAGSTNTCAKFSGGTVTEATKDSRNEIQDLYCNQQLQINGVVVTGALKLYRIYGASAGLDSITPAEIINYSPSIYMWGDDNASTGNSGIHTTYQRELAPRQ